MNKKLLQKIDLEFRPKSYWGELDKILSNIKGQWRREQVKYSLLKNEFIPEEILQDEISDELRDYISKIHPSFMGGEYLPNYKTFEVEIARVIYESTTRDVMSFRAKLGKSRIYYRIEDEYEDMSWISTRKSSLKPLTLKQLIKMILTAYVEGEDYPHKMMIDGTFFCDYFWEWEGIDHNNGFIRVESDFYPKICDYFSQLEDNWLSFCSNYYESEDEDENSLEKLNKDEVFKLASGGLLDI